MFKTIRLSKFLFAGTFLLSLCFKANAQTNDLGLKVHHITLSVKNIDTMVYWYTHVLDLKLIRKSDESARIELDGFFIDMLQVKGSSRQPSQDLSTDDHMQAQGWRHLEDTVNYEALVAHAVAIAASGHIGLVESFARRLAEACVAEPKVASARVRVEKPRALGTIAAVAGVEITAVRR